MIIVIGGLVADAHASLSPHFTGQVNSRKTVVLWVLGFVLFKPNKVKMGLHITKATCWPNPYTNIEVDYSSGAVSDAVLFAQIQKSIEQLDAEGYFQSPVQKYLVESTLKFRFAEPEFYGACFTPIDRGVELLKKCDGHGNLWNEMAILSNWGEESAPALQKYAANKVVFKYFGPQNVFISGEIKSSKPHPESFNYVINAWDVQPHEVVFIDDQIANMEAARVCGMRAIHLKNGDYDAVEAQLRAWVLFN